MQHLQQHTTQCDVTTGSPGSWAEAHSKLLSMPLLAWASTTASHSQPGWQALQHTPTHPMMACTTAIVLLLAPAADETMGVSIAPHLLMLVSQSAWL